MTTQTDVITESREPGSSGQGSPEPSATRGGESKRSIEQISLLLFICIPFVALAAAVPLAWGRGMSWLDVGLIRFQPSPRPSRARVNGVSPGRCRLPP